jgi:hemoglobin
VSAQDPTPFDRIGGAQGVNALVTRFYDLMSELPEAAHVLKMHPADLASSREKLRLFLTGWLGGPQLYVERFGHPRLRMRHLPFASDDAARDAWMRCMRQALDEHVKDPLLHEMLRGSFQRMADHMRNTGTAARPEDESPGQS